MNNALWVLQALAALMFAASGVMKVFMFDSVSGDVPSFGALPKRVWQVLGLVELICVVGLAVPPVLKLNPIFTVVAAGALSAETLIFIRVHIQYKEVGPTIFCALLGILMAVLAYGRLNFLGS